MTDSDTPLTAAAVADYLYRHPQFLADHPELAQRMLMPRGDGNTTSLSSYQIEVLRDKNRELQRRLRELVEIAQDNEQLMVQVHALTLALVRSADLGQALTTLVAGLREDFSTDLVRLVLFVAAPLRDRLPQADWLRFADGCSDPALASFEVFFARGEPLCGRLQQEKIQYLFGTEAAEVQSAVLLPLSGQGMLALGSSDPGRFHPGMGTVFLKLLGEVVAARLQAQRQRVGD